MEEQSVMTVERASISSPETEWVVNEAEHLVQAHYSSLTLHRKCPQAWYYRYGLGLRRPIEGPAPELHFGTWWSALRAAEALERGRKLGSLVAKPKKFSPIDGGPRFDQATLTAKEVYEASIDWWSKQDDIAQEAWRERIGAPLPERLKAAFVRWMDEWREERKTERPLGVEVFWERALPRPEGDGAWEVNGDPHVLPDLPILKLIGFIDEVYFDTARGMVVVRDNKSSKTLATQNALDDMMDSQLQLYAWGATPLLLSWGVEQPRVVAYDRIRSTAPTRPELTLAGVLSKQITQFDLRTYLEWSKEDTASKAVAEFRATDEYRGMPPELQKIINDLGPGRLWGKLGEFYATGAKKGQPKFGIYEPEQSMIEKLSTPAWRSAFHQRSITPLSRHVVRAHLRAAVDTAIDIWRTQKRAEQTAEAARNLSKENCRWCDFKELCRAQMVGGPDGEYDLREYGLRGRDGITVIGR